jgi:hypothetical protein
MNNKILLVTLAISLASLGFVPNALAQNMTGNPLPYAYSQLMKQCIARDQTSGKSYIESSCLTDSGTRMSLCAAFSDLENGTATRSAMHDAICKLAFAGMNMVNATAQPTHTPFAIGNMTSTSAPVHHHHHGGHHNTSRSNFGGGNATCADVNPADCPH